VNAISVNAAFEAKDDEVDSRSYEPMPRGKQRRPESRRKSTGGSGGGFHSRRNKSHSWGCGAGARLAALRAFAGAIAILLLAAASPASADSFAASRSAAPGSSMSPITGLGRLTDGFRAESSEVASTADAGVKVSDLAPLYGTADAVTLNATQLVSATATPTQWPIVSASQVPAVVAPVVLVDASDSRVPERFGDYVNSYSTYGMWETVVGGDAGDAPATADLLAFGDATVQPAMVGEEFLLSNLDRSEGLRVAVVAVPEPSNTVAAAFAIGGLIAVHFFRRRNLVPARVRAC